MKRSSPHTITYPSLVKLAEEALLERQARYAGAKARGTGNLEGLTH